MKKLITVVLFCLFFDMNYALAESYTKVFYNQHISDKILWNDTNFDITERANSGCIVEISATAGDEFVTKCSTSNDAAVKECSIEESASDALIPEILNPDPRDFEVSWSVTREINLVKLSCAVIGDRSDNADLEVNSITWTVGDTSMNAYDIPIVEDYEFYQVMLPLVTRAWSG